MFPKTVGLRIHCASLQSMKLKNEFKAIFELMKAQLLSPSLPNRFFIMRRRIEIERIVLIKNE